jgi:hypothetical protein
VPSLPPPVWAELFYDGVWNDITEDLRVTTSPVTITRGLSSESASDAEPTSCTCDLDSRDDRYAPRNPMSPLYGLIGRNTPVRTGYEAGSPWAQMSGTGKLTTPDSPSLAVTDLDVCVDVALDTWALPSGSVEFAGRYQASGDNRSWVFAYSATGQLYLSWSPDGTLTSRIDRFSTEPLVAHNGQRLAVRVALDVDNGAGGYEVRFYTGRTVDDTDWKLLGDPIIGTSPTAVFDGAAGLELGEVAGLTAVGPTGKLHAVKVLNGINGTVAASMRTSDAVPAATSFTSGGAVWTLAGDAVLTNRHIRMTGEVPAWPPTRDLSGNDNYVSITPSGIMRRMDAGNKPQDSSLLRFIKARNPVECWPLTDGPSSTGAKSLVGGSDMRQEILIGDGETAASWSGGRLADWIEPVLSAQANTSGSIRGACRRTAGTDAFWSVDLFLSGGGAASSGQFTVYDRGAGTDDDNRHSIQIVFTGSLDQLTIIRQSDGTDTSSAALLANIADVGLYTDDPHHLRLSIDPQASSTLWYVYVDGTLRGSGTISGLVLESAREVLLGWGYATLDGVTMTDRAFGYLTYLYCTGPAATDIYTAFMGHQGELAGDRIQRLATESGYVASVTGENVYQRPMGVQGQKKLLELLTEANRTNFGYLLEARDSNELIHRSHSTLWNQPPALTLDFSAGLIGAPFKPVDDDKLTENDVQVQREFGSLAARHVLEEGEMSVQDWPDGVGRYDRAYTYSLYTDDQADQVTYMRLHLGTYAGVRYTRLTLNLANERVHALLDDILRVDVGDKIRLTHLPADHGPDDVDVLVAGYTEEAGPDAWKITFNCLPGEPWTAGVVGESRADTGGSELAAAATATATSLSVATTGSWPWVTAALPLTPNWRFEAGITGWFSGGGASIAWDPQRGFSNPGSLKITAGGAATPRAEHTSVPVTAGASYTAGAWLYCDADITTGVRVAINWQASGAYLSTSSGTTTTIAAGGWTWLEVTATAPATATSGAIVPTISGTPATGATLWVALAALRTAGGSGMDFPFDVRVGGEVCTVLACTGATSPQTMTVVRAVNGISKAQPSGQALRLAHPVYVGM